MPEPDLIELFVTRLDAMGASYLVTGSVAATLYGEPRVMHDIDLIVELSAANRGALPHSFPETDFYLPPPDVVRLESERAGRGHFNIIHHASGLKADIYLVGDDELHNWAFRNARRYSVGGLEVQVAPPEYVITRKLEFYREGGSPKHVRDIRSMLSLSSNLIDRATLEDWIHRRGLDTAWSVVKSS